MKWISFYTRLMVCYLVFFSSEIIYSQVPAGDRILGMHVSTAESDDYPEAFTMALVSCIKGTHLFIPWNDLESTPGAFDGESVQYLDIANDFYTLTSTQVELNIAVTNTVTREVPGIFENTDWDDPQLVSYFNILLDSIFAHLPDLNLSALMIGNESDVLWGTDTEEVSHFSHFLEQVKPHAEELYFQLHGEDLNVGTTITYAGATSPATAAIYHDLNLVTDVIGITYYHTGSNFHVLPPVDVAANWALLEATYSDMEKPIYIVECGCPTSALLGGSEEHQANFITEVFNAWDAQFSRIKLVYFFMMHDWSQETVDELAIYYGLEGVEEFTEFLRTLGLRYYPGDGTDKQALNRLRCEVNARGFCTTPCVAEVEDGSPGNFSFYPNPADDFIRVNALANTTYAIMDLSGRMVATGNINNTGQLIEINQLAGGCYFLQLGAEQFPLIKNQ